MLKPLLFIHGRECYRRNSFAVIYMFYKNMLLTTPQLAIGFATGFSEMQDLLPVFFNTTFNLCFTAFPIIWYAVFDFEVSKK